MKQDPLDVLNKQMQKDSKLKGELKSILAPIFQQALEALIISLLGYCTNKILEMVRGKFAKF